MCRCLRLSKNIVFRKKGAWGKFPSNLKIAKNQDMCLIFGSLQGLARWAPCERKPLNQRECEWNEFSLWKCRLCRHAQAANYAAAFFWKFKKISENLFCAGNGFPRKVYLNWLFRLFCWFCCSFFCCFCCCCCWFCFCCFCCCWLFFSFIFKSSKTFLLPFAAILFCPRNKCFMQRIWKIFKRCMRCRC